MDVICVFNKAGEAYFTDFYIKLKGAVIDQAALAALGLHEGGVKQQASSSFPSANVEDVQKTKSDHQALFPPPEQEWIEICCNDKIVDIIAFIGESYFLHFFDATSNSYSRTPNKETFAKLPLNPGRNHVTCTQRTTGLMRDFDIWCYNVTDKLVVMDIDGTITKSDVTGYIQTVYMGMFSYIHEGVVPFLNILQESYKFRIIYLTSRPMIHQKETRQFIRGIKDENGLLMPEGPLFPSKDRIMQALYREIISKTTTELKSGVLNTIGDVFREAGCTRLSPFILGIGNKETDAFAYNLSGLSADRILLIDPNSNIIVWKYQQLLKTPSLSAVSSTQTTPAITTKKGILTARPGKIERAASEGSPGKPMALSGAVEASPSHNRLLNSISKHISNNYGIDFIGTSNAPRSEEVISKIRHSAVEAAAVADDKPIYQFQTYKDMNLLKYIDVISDCNTMGI